MTTGELTKKAIAILQDRNCEVWRQNQIPVRGRAFTGKPGQSDIIGYHKVTCIFVACEVKNTGDKLSDDQKEFLLGVAMAGGFALVAIPYGNTVQLIDYLTLK